jgi:predicted CoA-binding protein
LTEAEQVLASATSVLIVDWPSRDVPDTLARAGYTVVVKSGPEPENYSFYLVENDEIAVRAGGPPGRIDLLYFHRPLDELPGLIAMARETGARALWGQSGLASAGVKDPRGCWVPDDASRHARGLVEAAGLQYIDSVYIADAVRLLRLRD